jgi:hypothetical protein
MNLIRTTSALALFAATACTHAVSHGTSGEAATSDIASLAQRADGQFDVVCKSGHKEVDSAEAVQSGAVCAAAQQTPGTTVASRDSSFYVIYNTSGAKQTASIGSDWSGYASFTLYSEEDTTAITDGFGNTYSVSSGATQTFQRLPTPITFQAAYYVQLTAISYEVDSIDTYTGQQAFTGKADVAQSVTTLYQDMKGAALSFTADATFFANFTNNAGCDVIVITDEAGQQVTLKPDANDFATATKTLYAPLLVASSPSCRSARLRSPENPDADYRLSFTAVSTGTP